MQTSSLGLRESAGTAAMNRAVFFGAVRADPFGGRLTQGQVDGLNRLLDAWKEHKPFDDLRWLAYCLGTAYHETAHTMMPVEEIGRGRGKEYGKPHPVTGKRYYGRGDVQLTWHANYDRAGRELGIDLVNDPDRMLDPEISARVLFLGMREGWFTGRRLGHFLTDRNTDWIGARRIVNGTDRAALIAGYAKAFHAALIAATEAAPVEEDRDPDLEPAAAGSFPWHLLIIGAAIAGTALLIVF